MLAALIPVAIWPGDVSWLIDEPRLIANAYYFNQDRIPAHTGLFGNFGVPYGPVPTQIYQVLLWFTHDPEMLVVLRGLLCAVLTSIGLLWMARTLEMPRWFAAAILIAPNVVAFHRILWDASFTIPLGALCVAALADFLKTKRRWSLRLCVVCTILLPINHPQALPLAVPIAAYLLWRHRAEIRSDKSAMWRMGAVLFILHFLYIGAVIGVLHWKLTQGGGNLQYPIKGERWVSALSPFLGGNLLTGFDYAQSVARPAGAAWLVDAAMWVSRLIYPLIWVGILAASSHIIALLPMSDRLAAKIAAIGKRLGILSLLRRLRVRSKNPITEFISVLMLVCLAVQFVIFTALRIPAGPQYFFGTFALHAFFAFAGMQALGKARCVVGGLLLAANTFITIGGMSTVHHRGYEAPGWPTMANCLGAVRQLNRYDNHVVLTDIELFLRFPQPIRTLRLLIPPETGAKPSQRRLFLSYKRKDGVTTGEMVVTELSPDEKRPPGSYLMIVSPLPQDWVPDPSTW